MSRRALLTMDAELPIGERSNKSCTAPDVRRVSKAHRRGRNEPRKNSLTLRTFVCCSCGHPVHHILCTGPPSKSPDMIRTAAPSDRRRWYMSNTTAPDVPDLHPDDHVWGRRICIFGPPYLRLQRHTDHRSGRWYMVCKSHYSGSPWHPDNRNIIFSSAVVCRHTSWGIYPGSKVCNTHNSPTELAFSVYASSCTNQHSVYAVSHYPCHSTMDHNTQTKEKYMQKKQPLKDFIAFDQDGGREIPYSSTPVVRRWEGARSQNG